MHIGIDFDNTIVCYDKVFYQVAVEKGLIPSDIPPGKNNVRDYLRKIGKEDEWTRLQGLVYGTRMNYAEAFSGVFDFMKWCQEDQIAISIISHKTRHPYMGPDYDLHLAALQWMETQDFFEPRNLGLPRAQVFLELTKTDKIGRIINTGCTHFIDDLPEFLLEPDFPQNVISILFDPNNMVTAVDFPFRRCSSWDEILIDFKTTRKDDPE